MSLVVGSTTRKIPRRAYRSAEYLEERRFLARETRTLYVEPLDTYDPRPARLPDQIAASLGAHGVMPHAIAEEDVEAHLADIAGEGDIDPSDTKRYMLQCLARDRARWHRYSDTLTQFALLCVMLETCHDNVSKSR